MYCSLKEGVKIFPLTANSPQKLFEVYFSLRFHDYSPFIESTPWENQPGTTSNRVQDIIWESVSMPRPIKTASYHVTYHRLHDCLFSTIEQAPPSSCLPRLPCHRTNSYQAGSYVSKKEIRLRTNTSILSWLIFRWVTRSIGIENVVTWLKEIIPDKIESFNEIDENFCDLILWIGSVHFQRVPPRSHACSLAFFVILFEIWKHT